MFGLKSTDVCRTLTCGAVLAIAFLVLDVLSFANPLVTSIIAPYAGLSIWKFTNPTAPGVSNIFFLPFLFELINGILLAEVWFLINKSLPGKGWMKGLNYGVLVGLFRVVMGAFSTYVMYTVPDIVLITTGFVSFIEILILGVLTQQVCERVK